MNKKEINEMASKYASMSGSGKKHFIEAEKKRIKSLSATENKKELYAIKKLLTDMRNEIRTILQK